MTPAEDPLFLRACRGLGPVERTPIWVMRQAGRYLPEYQAVRKKTPFLELCKTPELAAEVTMQPIRRFGMDAAIIFSDLLIPVEAMGLPLVYDEAPRLLKTIRSIEDVEALSVPDPTDRMNEVLEAIRLFRQEMPKVPLIGFAGAPFTLASYMIEGEGSRTFTTTKQLLYQEPKTGRALLRKVAETVTNHLLAQVEAGAQAVQIFDSWAGALSRDDYLDFGLPFTIQIIDAIKRKTEAPVILFAKGMHACLPELALAGADVLGVDWTIPLDVAGHHTDHRVVLQGNLDPSILLAPPTVIERQVQRVMNEARRLKKGHIFNLGHGIHKTTPPEHVAVLVDAVKRVGRNEVA